MNTNFLAENALSERSPYLHKRYTRCVKQSEGLLARYHDNFPEFTDHSLLHAIEVTNLANHLISNRIEKLNADELYILLMGILLHDVGMGIDKKHFARYYKIIQPGSALPDEPDALVKIRQLHHELSALFILEHQKDFFIPQGRYAQAIAAVGKGHRIVDLNDILTYPKNFKLSGSLCVNLPYLAAVVRLADELDVSAARNPILQFAGFVPGNERGVMEFQKHRSITNARFVNDMFVVDAATDERQEYDALCALFEGIEEALRYCQEVTRANTGDSLPITRIQANIRYTNQESALTIEQKRDECSLTLYLGGRLDTNTAVQLEERLCATLGPNIHELCLDLEKIDYISSAGLRVLLSAKKKMLAQNGAMSMKNVCPEVYKVFLMTGFCAMIEIHEI